MVNSRTHVSSGLILENVMEILYPIILRWRTKLVPGEMCGLILPLYWPHAFRPENGGTTRGNVHFGRKFHSSPYCDPHTFPLSITSCPRAVFCRSLQFTGGQTWPPHYVSILCSSRKEQTIRRKSEWLNERKLSNTSDVLPTILPWYNPRQSTKSGAPATHFTCLIFHSLLGFLNNMMGSGLDPATLSYRSAGMNSFFFLKFVRPFIIIQFK